MRFLGFLLGARTTSGDKSQEVKNSWLLFFLLGAGPEVNVWFRQ